MRVEGLERSHVMLYLDVILLFCSLQCMAGSIGPPAHAQLYNIIPSHSQMHIKFSIILIIYLSAVELFHLEEYLFFCSNSQGSRTIMN